MKKGLRRQSKTTFPFRQVINQQPDEQQPYNQYQQQQYGFSENQIIPIRSLPLIPYQIPISQQKVNQLINDIKQVIEKIQTKITIFYQKCQGRQFQLRIYNKSLDQFRNILDYSMRMDQKGKIFIVKKVIRMLNQLGKIQKKDLYRLIYMLQAIDSNYQYINQKQHINHKQHIHDKHYQINQEYQHINTKQSQIKDTDLIDMNLVGQNRTYKSFSSIQTTNKIVNKCFDLLSKNKQSKQKDEYLRSRNEQFRQTNYKQKQKVDNFKQVLQRVEKIHIRNLKSWSHDKAQQRQLNQLQKQIKVHKSTFNNKSFQNRRILIKSTSLKIISKNNKNQSQKKQNQQTNLNVGLNKNKITHSSKDFSTFKNINFQINGLLSLEEEEKKYKPNKHKQDLLILETAQSKQRNRLEHLRLPEYVKANKQNTNTSIKKSQSQILKSNSKQKKVPSRESSINRVSQIVKPKAVKEYFRKNKNKATLKLST